MNRRPLVRSLLASAALAAAIALSGCQTDGNVASNAKAMKPLSDKMIAEISEKNMEKDSPILVRLFKEESELEIWKQERSGRFALLKTYPICRWSGELGPKIKEGDRQAPEGFYTITPGQMNPNSQYYLSFDLGYPNAFDRAHGRTGAHLMVHGDCSSRGCYSMTDEQISEIYALGREAFFGGQRSFQVQAYPFRMTPQNMAKHRNNPHMAFWRMLKQGNDHFEVTRLEPKVNVCERRYVFNAQHPDDPSRSLSFNGAAKCPTFEVPQDIMAAVQDKQRQDERRTAELTGRTPAAPVRTYADGGMHPVFAAAVKRQQTGTAAPAFSLASVPGTIPAHVRPPRTEEFSDHPNVAAAPAVSTNAPARVAAATPAVDPHAPVPQSTPAPMPGSGNMFGNLFSSAPSNAKTAGPLDRMARLIGLRGSEAEAEQKPAPAAARQRPAPRTQTTAPGAIRPRPAAAEPLRTATAQEPAPVSPVTALAPQQPSAPTAALAGSAPTVPAGSFENRWSGFR